ncbi:hypothetical protein AGMMS50233_11300 [Endomicrobiia bacterium]|nr:hypothetical protein AGMMS49990_09210 [Endomicrobiia bacterium]GHT57998.1 hypothetical protein AGMMS50233_11300 [Endomicrobiia bacterium]
MLELLEFVLEDELELLGLRLEDEFKLLELELEDELKLLGLELELPEPLCDITACSNGACTGTDSDSDADPITGTGSDNRGSDKGNGVVSPANCPPNTASGSVTVSSVGDTCGGCGVLLSVLLLL